MALALDSLTMLSFFLLFLLLLLVCNEANCHYDFFHFFCTPKNDNETMSEHEYGYNQKHYVSSLFFYIPFSNVDYRNLAIRGVGSISYGETRETLWSFKT